MRDTENRNKDIVESVKKIEKGFIVLWTYQELIVDKIEDGEVGIINWESIDRNDIVRIRIFNENVEHHYWRSGIELKCRERIDNMDYEETQMAVVGTIKKQLQGLGEFKTIDTNKEKIGIKTYHFYEANKIGQVGYVDMRFVGFKIQKETNEKRKIS
ncbi:MAG: CRISPR-associated protein Csx19 [Saprospiraceae bacterium]